MEQLLAYLIEKGELRTAQHLDGFPLLKAGLEKEGL